MTDTMMIRDCIRSQGMKLGHVAHVLDITQQHPPLQAGK